MKVLILTSSPNADGLTAACGRSAAQGVKAAGHQAEVLNLCKQQLNSCRACGNGWGACRAGQVCTGVQDDFSQIQQRAREADALVLVTPVYYGQMSERMKAFCDRLRRCDALREGKGAFQGKPVLLVAAAGGVGYTISLALKLFCDQTSSSDYGALFAMSTLSLVPIFLIFAFMQKYLTEGVATSGIKG